MNQNNHLNPGQFYFILHSTQQAVKAFPNGNGLNRLKPDMKGVFVNIITHYIYIYI